MKSSSGRFLCQIFDSFFRPVSYTHLDVYKRQVGDGGTGILVLDHQHAVDHLVGDALVAVSGDDDIELRAGTVSYTHLDVYKRQVRHR